MEYKSGSVQQHVQQQHADLVQGSSSTGYVIVAGYFIGHVFVAFKEKMISLQFLISVVEEKQMH